METAKFALAGSIVGVGAAYVGDALNARVLNPILRPTQGTMPTPAGMYGRLAFQVVGGTLVAGGVIYAGDKLLDRIVTGDDPLFRTFYLLTAFTSMRLINQNTQSAMAGLNAMIQPVLNGMGDGKARHVYDTPQQPMKSGCTAKGGCSH